MFLDILDWAGSCAGCHPAAVLSRCCWIACRFHQFMFGFRKQKLYVEATGQQMRATFTLLLFLAVLSFMCCVTELVSEFLTFLSSWTHCSEWGAGRSCSIYSNVPRVVPRTHFREVPPHPCPSMQYRDVFMWKGPASQGSMCMYLMHVACKACDPVWPVIVHPTLELVTMWSGSV